MVKDSKVYGLLKPLIVGLVSEDPGIKGVNLVVEVTTHVFKSPVYEGIETSDILETIDLMVELGDIVEVEYSLKATPYRLKSLYFPAGTEVAVVPPSSPTSEKVESDDSNS